MRLAPLRLVPATYERRAAPTPVRAHGEALIGQILVDRGALSPGDLLKALALHAREDVRLGEILLTHGMVDEAELYAGLADQWNARIVDLARDAPDPRLVDAAGADFCLRHRLVPWRRIGGATVHVTSRPEEFAERAAELPAGLSPCLLAIAPERDILEALLALRSRRLALRAERRVAEEMSCRTWDGRRFSRALALLAALIAAGLVAYPMTSFALLTFLALLAVTANTGLRLAAIASQAYRGFLCTEGHGDRTRGGIIARLPVVSVLVPLYQETAIADRLLRRLERLTYPRELLDICLVTEDNDTTTQATLAATPLPRWMRVVTVPDGGVRTKPRALNYALDFCRGSIIGVYDAEDAPAPDQIHRIVARFHERGPEVACLQGVLDYYNARSNWMARCFALEYAGWFRVILPGIARLGLAVPLGGTTLFFRRAALEALGGWDAHNVTEDADLGLRLARRGLRTELIDTLTEEEANSRLWPWVRQRSRWIKGYAMTWAVHMRDPSTLWRDLGPRRFVGMQVLFLGSLAQALLAPVLWSFWLVPLGLPHPVLGRLGTGPVAGIALLLVAAFAVNIAVSLIGTSGPRHRHLRPWALTLEAYFPLATLAALKAVVELITRPFFWDKTDHGLDDEGHAPFDAAAPEAFVPAHAPAECPALRPALAAPVGEVRPLPEAPLRRA